MEGKVGCTTEKKGKVVGAPGYSVQTSHPIYTYLLGEYGLVPKKRQKLGGEGGEGGDEDGE